MVRAHLCRLAIMGDYRNWCSRFPYFCGNRKVHHQKNEVEDLIL